MKVELGCGTNKKNGFIGVDSLNLPGVDIVHNIEEGLGIFEDDSVDEIYSAHFLEHIENFEFLITEIHRVLKSTGKKVIIVPHFSNPYYYSDYTHKRFFGLYSMDYFSDGNNKYRRKVPNFYTDVKFKVISRKLKFGAHPFYIRNKIMAIFTHFFNISPYMQELYEGTFSSFIPCHEVNFEIQPIKD
ncbi:MAG: methyltransferase domain-containing protein [Saprospiraceae bacterium]|jgi:predicted SAM-dependent methyltransferase|nr:methyltransferase domain-containing protein [Saprospiraceae bacterium]MBL0099729.1 methyltransferase domain-containing protein [Saprospiraceae bacterium]